MYFRNTIFIYDPPTIDMQLNSQWAVNGNSMFAEKSAVVKYMIWQFYAEMS